MKVACTVWSGENPEITSKDYLSLSGAKSQGIKQLMAGAGIMLLGTYLDSTAGNIVLLRGVVDEHHHRENHGSDKGYPDRAY